MNMRLLTAVIVSLLATQSAWADSNFSWRFQDLHLKDRTAGLTTPASPPQCGNIHDRDWSCPSADASAQSYRGALEQRWDRLDALMSKVQRWPQRYDRTDFDLMIAQIGLTKEQMPEDLAKDVYKTRRLVDFHERAKLGG